MDPFAISINSILPMLEFVLWGLSLGTVTFCVGLYLLHVIAIGYGKYYLHRKVDPLHNPPGVSIIKPLVGEDENLFFNLKSFFKMDYPKYELLFCLNSKDDPAFKVVETLCQKYPDIETNIFIGGQNVGLNQKINNMFPAYKASRYPNILISDACIYMKENALMNMMRCMGPKIGMVIQMPYCMDRPSFGSNLEQVYFGSVFGRQYLASEALGFNVTTGMSALMRKNLLDECGGLAPFGRFLGEDYFIAKVFIKKGWKVVISHMPALQNVSNTDPKRWRERLYRWIKLRTTTVPQLIFFEPISECFLSGFLGSLSISYLLGIAYGPMFALFHVAYWMIMDYVLLRTVQNDTLPFSKLQYAICWFYREAMALPIYLTAVSQKDITWKNGTYRLGWFGHILPKEESKK